MIIQNKTEYSATESKYYSDIILIILIWEKSVFYLSILSLSIGIPGNIISILIFSKPCLNNKTNTGFLYTFLCVFNLIAILYNVFVINSLLIFNYYIRFPLNSDALIENVILQMLSWFQVLITFDRFIAVVYPIKGVRIMSKRWVLYSIILGMLVVIIGLNSPYFIKESLYMFDLYDMNETQRNILKCISVYIEIIKVSMQVFVPYSIIMILDSITIIRLRRIKSNLSERQSTESNSCSKSWRFTRNTILIDLIYLIVKLPSAIFDFYFIYIIVNMLIENLPAIFNLIIQIFSHLPYIYSSFLFILFICFNKIFRAEFIALISQQRFFIFVKKLFV